SSSTSSKRRVRQVLNSSAMAWQTRDTVDLDSAACGPSASASVASTSRTDRPRTNPAITNVSNALVLDTAVPKSRETNLSSVPRSFGRATVTGPVVVLTVVAQNPLREPARASGTSARRAERARPRNSSTPASTAVWISSRAPSRATSSTISARSRPEPNSASNSARIFSVGDTRDGTGVVLPVQTLAVLYGTYARRHLHRLMDTTDSGLAKQIETARRHVAAGKSIEDVLI